MKKIELIELLQWELSGGEMTSDIMGKYDAQSLSKRLDIEWNEILMEVVNAVKRTNYFDVFDTLTKTFTLTIQKDSTRNEYYAELPSLASIPQDVAIRSIRPADSPTIEYIPLQQGSLPIFNKIAGIPQETGYYPEGLKIWFVNHNGATSALARLVPQFSAFDDEDQIPEPVGMKGELYNRTLDRLGGLQVTPQDKINNNNLT